MPKSSVRSKVRSKRSVALAVVATVVGVCAAVLLSGQATTAQAAAAPGATVRASVVDGTNAQSPGGGADQELSSDGTAVAFTTDATLDDLDTDGWNSVYVRDLRRNRTVLISRGQFTRPSVDDDDGGVDAVPPTLKGTGDPLLSLNGAQPAPPPVSPGQVPPNNNSEQPTISADGRYVAFTTNANNIIVEDADTDTDILVCDRDPDGDGEFDEESPEGERLYRYFRVNKPVWQQGQSAAFRADYPTAPKLSDDAGRIVYHDFYAPPEGAYVETVMTAVLRPPGGAVGEPGTVEHVTTPLGKLEPTAQYEPDVSGDGRFVVLRAEYVRQEGSGEFPNYIPFNTIVRKDMATGAVLRVDWDVNTTPDDVTFLSEDETVHLYSPVISGNGGEIAFVAEEFQSNCEDGCWRTVADQPMVFVVRIGPDGTPVDSVIASRDNDNEIINGLLPGLSGDGRFVAFGTDNVNAHDGVDGSTNENGSCVTFKPGFAGKPMISLNGLPPTSDARDNRVTCQVVVRDLVVDRERLRNEEPRLPGTLVSAGTPDGCDTELPEGGTCVGDSGSPPYLFSSPVSLSHNGSTVAFESWATNLVPGEVDDNDAMDVFVRTFRPELRADPSPLDFGEVELEDTFDRTVRFDHVGTGPLVVTAIAVEGDDFAVGAQTCSGEAVVLQQTGNCEVSVSFTPTAAGARTGTLVLTTRDGRQFTVPLQGTGSEEPVPPENARFTAGPDPLAFGQRLLISQGPALAVTVTNTGGSALTINDISIISALAPNDYAISTDTCSDVPVAPAGTCQVTVAFSPTAPLERPAVLRFVDDIPGGDPHLIGLTGAGSQPTVELSPAVTQPGRVVTVTGAGFAPNQAVTVVLVDSVAKTTAVTNDAGGFTAALLILSKEFIGTRSVVATVDTFTSITANKPLLIVTPSVTPSDFVIRR